MERARALSLRLTEDLDDERARTQPDPAFSPIAWHLGHVAWQEEVWLHRKAWGRPPIEPEFDPLFDSFRSPKASRSARLPPLEAIREYVARVREGSADLASRTCDSELVEDGWVFRFLANHERQHTEIIGIARLLLRLPLQGGFDPVPDANGRQTSSWSSYPEGSFVMGSEDPDGWDNERRPHLRYLWAFRLAGRQVTNGEWLEFLEAGGYETRSLWSDEGWAFVRVNAISAPLHWERDAGGAWRRFSLRGWVPLATDHPVAHVSFFEAEAYARFAGARLPTEAEWERAARGEEDHRFPGGDLAEANLELRRGDTTPAGGLAGNVWEWTRSAFEPYPGFCPGPYRGYSEPWFGEKHRVLRGGSYLTHPLMARSTFRNWLEPQVRAYPTGLRLARDGA
jgi:iron(II)-dependent oxidoreductase